MMPHRGAYPDNWDEIAYEVKAKNNWCCERCGHTHHVASGYCLTVHHLDLDKSNCEDWNLAALCQRCHLHIQQTIVWEQEYLFEHSEWMEPHVEGYHAQRARDMHKTFLLEGVLWNG